MKTFEPTSNKLQLQPFKKATEFEIHSFLFAGLLLTGATVRGQVLWKDPTLQKELNKLHKRRMCCTFDLVIFNPYTGKAVEILEIKRARKFHRGRVEKTQQCQRYRLFGLPVTYIFGMKDAKKYLETLINRGEQILLNKAKTEEEKVKIYDYFKKMYANVSALEVPLQNSLINTGNEKEEVSSNDLVTTNVF